MAPGDFFDVSERRCNSIRVALSSRTRKCQVKMRLSPPVPPPHASTVTPRLSPPTHSLLTTQQHNTKQHSTAQHCTALHCTAQHSTTQHSTAQHNTTQHNAIQHSSIQHNTVQHNCMQHKTTIISVVSL